MAVMKTSGWLFLNYPGGVFKTLPNILGGVFCKKRLFFAKHSAKLFWFLTTLVAFAIAYMLSIMQTGFLMANTCVHK